MTTRGIFYKSDGSINAPADKLQLRTGFNLRGGGAGQDGTVGLGAFLQFDLEPRPDPFVLYVRGGLDANVYVENGGISADNSSGTQVGRDNYESETPYLQEGDFRSGLQLGVGLYRYDSWEAQLSALLMRNFTDEDFEAGPQAYLGAVWEYGNKRRAFLGTFIEWYPSESGAQFTAGVGGFPFFTGLMASIQQ